MSLILTMLGTLLSGFAFGVFLSRSSGSSHHIQMLERRVKMLLRENADLQLKLHARSDAELVDVMQVLPAGPAVIRWKAWIRTYADQWERWDETDSWYLAVEVRSDGTASWHAAYAPDAAKNGISDEGVVEGLRLEDMRFSSKVEAMKIAQEWAEKRARTPALLKVKRVTGRGQTEVTGDDRG